MIQHKSVPDVVDALDELIQSFFTELPRRQHAASEQSWMDHINNDSYSRAKKSSLTKSISAYRTIPENADYRARHAVSSSGLRETKADLPYSLPRELTKFKQLELPSLPPMIDGRGSLDKVPQYCPNCSFLLTQNKTGRHISNFEDHLESNTVPKFDSLHAREARSKNDRWPRDCELQARSRRQSQHHLDGLNGRTDPEDGVALNIERSSEQQERINPFLQSPLSLLAALALTP